jgi:hypothetical protein
MIDDIWRTCCRSQDSAKKGPSRHHISKYWKILAKYPEINILPEDGGSQKGRSKGAAGPHTTRWRGPSLATPPWGEATLAHSSHHPLAYRVFPQNLSREGGPEIDSATSAGRKTQREKSSPAGRNLSGKFLPGEGRSSPSPSRRTSSGSLIRPFCITILYHNLLLFIDVFHI